jgi:hypothetical protein
MTNSRRKFTAEQKAATVRRLALACLDSLGQMWNELKKL